MVKTKGGGGAEQLLAAVLGRARFEDGDMTPLDADGRISTCAPPLAIQFEQDLASLAESEIGENFMGALDGDIKKLFTDQDTIDEFGAMDMNYLRSAAVLTAAIPPPMTHSENRAERENRDENEKDDEAVMEQGAFRCRISEDGNVCDGEFDTLKAWMNHARRHHSYRCLCTTATITNQCCLCNTVFATRTTAARHLTLSIKRGGVCHAFPNTLKKLDEDVELNCPICDFHAASLRAIQAHLSIHVRAAVEAFQTVIGSNVGRTSRVARGQQPIIGGGGGRTGSKTAPRRTRGQRQRRDTTRRRRIAAERTCGGAGETQLQQRARVARPHVDVVLHSPHASVGGHRDRDGGRGQDVSRQNGGDQARGRRAAEGPAVGGAGASSSSHLGSGREVHGNNDGQDNASYQGVVCRVLERGGDEEHGGEALRDSTTLPSAESVLRRETRQDSHGQDTVEPRHWQGPIRQTIGGTFVGSTNFTGRNSQDRPTATQRSREGRTKIARQTQRGIVRLSAGSSELARNIVSSERVQQRIADGSVSVSRLIDSVDSRDRRDREQSKRRGSTTEGDTESKSGEISVVSSGAFFILVGMDTSRTKPLITLPKRGKGGKKGKASSSGKGVKGGSTGGKTQTKSGQQ